MKPDLSDLGISETQSHRWQRMAELPDDRECWARLSRLASEAAGRCRRRNERRKAAWFTRQSTLARERRRGLIHGGSFPQPFRD